MPKIREYLDGLSSTKENTFAIGGYTAIVTVEETETLANEITEYTTEEGARVSDYIIHKPVIFKITGVTSDIIIKPTKLQGAIKNIQNRYGEVQSYLPSRTQAQISRFKRLGIKVLNIKNKIEDIKNKANRVLQISSVGDYKQDFIIKIRNAYYDREELNDVYINGQRVSGLYIKNVELKTDNKIEKVMFTIELQKLGVVKNPNNATLQGNEKVTKRGTIDATPVKNATASTLNNLYGSQVWLK